MCVGTPQFEAAERPSRTGSRRGGGVAGLPAGPRASLSGSTRRLHDHPASGCPTRRGTRHRPRPYRRVGASAGGGLAAAVAQRSLDEGIPLRAQVLVYPMIDDRAALRDDLAGRGELTWSPPDQSVRVDRYLGREPRMSDAPEYAAPARRTDLSGLPPAWIGVGDLDVFYDEDVDYAEKLKAAGCRANSSPCRACITVPTASRRKPVNAGLSAQHGGALTDVSVAHRVRRHRRSTEFCVRAVILAQRPWCRFRRNRLRG